MNVHGVLRAAEAASVFDGPAERSAQLVERLPGRRWKAALRGSWLGHPVHPLLVTVPIGAWVGSAVFSLGFDDHKTARRLLGIGLAATPPTVLTGVVDLALLHREQRRVGMLHALLNTCGIALIALAFRRYGREQHRSATVYSLVGLVFIGAGGALGGHLSYAQGAGVHRWERARGVGDLIEYARGHAA